MINYNRQRALRRVGQSQPDAATGNQAFFAVSTCRALLAAVAVTLFCALPLKSGPVSPDIIVFDASSNGQFGTVDLTTGALTQTGNMGIAPAGLGEIGSTLFTAAQGGTQFDKLNPATGAVTQISNVGLKGAVFDGFGSTLTALYAIDDSFNLYSINPATGAATLIGPTGFAPGVIAGSYAFSLSTDSSTLYLADDYDIYSVNTTTGKGTLIGQSGAPGIGFNSLVEEDGTLYGIESSNTLPYNTVYTIDTSTGAGTPGATLSPDIPVASWGLAPAFAVPEPSSLLLLALLGILAAAVGGSKQRKGIHQ